MQLYQRFAVLLYANIYDAVNKKHINLHFLKELICQSLNERMKRKLRFPLRYNSLVRQLRVQLPDLANDLESACKGSEPEFMQIGQELQAIYTDATKLTRQVRDSVNLIGGKEGKGILFLLRETAEQSLAELQSCRKNVSEKTSLMKTVMEYLDNLSTMLPLVEKVGLLLRVISVNIGIECVRSNESTDLFSVVVQETKELSDKIKGISNEGLDVLKKAQATQRALYGDLSEGLNKIDRMGEKAGTIVKGAVRQIENLIVSTLQIAEQAGEHSRCISQQVGNLVVAVQFHDSMRQREEHATKVLCDIERLLAEDAKGKENYDHKSKLSIAHSIINLQHAQLKDIISEIGRVYEMSVRSFEEIIMEFSAMLNRLSDLSPGPDQIQRQKGRDVDPFERLRSSFGDLNGVLHQGQALMEPVRQAASRASGMVAHISGLFRDIHTIGFETHLIALNAIVKAAHLSSKGSALEVLAQEVKHSSDRSMSIMERMDEPLGLVTDVAAKLRDQSTNREAEISLESSIEQIARTYHRFMETTTVIHERADEIKKAILKTKADLNFLPLLSETLTGFMNQLEVFALKLTPFTSEEHRLNLKEKDRIIECYTTDKERQVHEIHFLGLSDRQPKNVMPEDLPDADAKAEQAAKGEPENGQKDNIELFTDEMTENEEIKEKEDNFGDNVELF